LTARLRQRGVQRIVARAQIGVSGYIGPKGPAKMSARIELLGLTIDPLTLDQAVHQVLSWAAREDGAGCRYVVTPNVDHVVLLQQNASLRAAYETAGLILADGAPVIWASRFLGSPLPERVAGSDLVPALFEAADAKQPVSVFLLGAAPGVGDKAALAIQRRWPGVRVVGTHSPPLGFERDEAENRAILAKIEAAQPDILVVGLGAPKQELWVHQHHRQIRAKAALCVGATIDFLAGAKSRAPAWMRELGLEWLHRLASEPRRLATRYARDAWVFPQLVARAWWHLPRAART
jgi:N-acetylglucosaminyldiphosphoundecaprenol N-acetyl-beta-D-mannosaminyltransferase